MNGTTAQEHLSLRIRVEHREAQSVTEHEFSSSPIRIGRSPLNDIRLPYPFVSSWHAMIRFDEQQAHFFDLGSTNGTERDGQRLEPGEPVPIDGDVRLTIGDIDLVLERSAAPRLRQGAMQSIGREAVGTIDTDDPLGIAGARQRGSNETKHLPASQVHRSIAALAPLHEELRRATLRFETALREHVERQPPHLREYAEVSFRREFGSSGTPTALSAERVTRFAQLLVPELPPPTSDEEADAFMRSVRDVLETCVKGVLELRRGRDRFGVEMRVRPPMGDTELDAVNDVRTFLHHLLDWRSGGPERSRELSGTFADAMLHNVAVLNGVVAGSRSMLASLDPDEIERQSPRRLATRSAARWREFVRRHQALMSEQGTLSDFLFGPEFVQAYERIGSSPEPEPRAPSNPAPSKEVSG